MTSPFGGQNSDLSSLPAGAQPGGIGTTTTTSPVTAPSPLTALLPHIASSTSGLGLTPGSNPFLALQPGSGVGAGAGAGGNGTIMTPGGSLSLGAGSGSGSGSGAGAGIGIGMMGAPSPFPLTFPLPPNASLPTAPAPISQGQITAGLGLGAGGAGSVRSGNGSGNTSGREVSLDQTIRGLEEGLGMIERAMEIGRTLQTARDGVFGSEEGPGIGNGNGSGVGSIGNLQLEYSQIINSLYLLAQSSQFGAIPLVPSPQTTSATTTTTTQDLTEWCETRSALEFGRREGVKAGNKVVLDILGGRS